MRRVRQPTPPLPRILARIEIRPGPLDTPCWIWPGATASTGYGRVALGSGRNAYAHRVVYEALVGPIPDGLVLDHLCCVIRCCCPEHLRPVTHRENILRSEVSIAGRNSRKTHCDHGHEFTPENTYTNRLGGRNCRACAIERSKARWRALHSHAARAQ